MRARARPGTRRGAVGCQGATECAALRGRWREGGRARGRRRAASLVVSGAARLILPVLGAP